MPANQRQQIANPKSLAQPPPSPSSKSTAKYTNKDGSKFISVPKSPDASEIPTAAMVQTGSASNAQVPPAPPNTNGTNKKKQKRREKMAARLAAGQGAQGSNNISRHGLETQQVGTGIRHATNGQFDPAEEEVSSEEDYEGPYDQDPSSPNGHSNLLSNPPAKSSKKKKRSKSGRSNSEQAQPTANGMYQNHSHNHPAQLLSSLPQNMPRGPGISREKIWNTSSQEERERIKEFWLSLGEDERKSLVKVEKDAVLKKMKEQQKHSCSCTVCGRKRTAIEEELEVLYDAYYEELEQYANHRGEGGHQPMMPPPRRFGSLGGLQPPNRMPPAFQQPSRGRIIEQSGDDEDEEGDEEYSDDPDEDEYSEEEPDEIPRSYQTDFFNFGNSLTVQGGILTVADDLLKNDGKKFIEMMEQLAERRMQREEDNHNQQAFHNHGPNSIHAHHTHNPPPPPVDEEYDDEEGSDDYDSQDEDYDEDDEEELDTMTEEQRMEEGRRMFQIFAARMFEQRVLTAYKEKVARERQEKLMEEVEEESKREAEKKAKKAKEAQKKKEKTQLKKQQAAEAQARKDAEKAAEEAAKAEADEKAREAQRQKDEERRKKREATKQADAAERLKKEAEKQRRIQETKDRQADEDRKKREAKEKEREKKEEARRLEREAKEVEAKERKAKQEQEKREREATIKAEKDARDKQQRDELATQQAAVKAAVSASHAPKRPPVPIPANFQSQPAAIASPHVQVATPAVPKAPTPSRLRTTSQQESSGSSVPQTPQTGGLSQNVSPVPSTPLQGSPGPIGPPGKPQNHPYLHHPQASSPMHSALKNSPGLPSNPYPGIPLSIPFQSGAQPPMMPPGFGRMPFDPVFPHPPMGGQFRPMPGPNGIPGPPGMIHQMPQGRGFPIPNPPPGFPQSPNAFGGIGQPFSGPKDAAQAHSRHPSASFDVPTSVPTTQPIGRPAPIGRPSSVVHGQRHGEHLSNEVDDLSNALGSSALIDDSDEPLNGPGPQRSNGAPGNIQRHNFPPPPFGMEQFSSPMSTTPWGAQPNPFGSTSLPGSNFTGGWPQSTNNSFGAPGGSSLRASLPRNVRLMICQACKELDGSTLDGFYDIDTIKAHIEMLHPPVSEEELIAFCGTEGNPSNGGGYLDVRNDAKGHVSIRYENDALTQRMSAPGEIGSPIVGGGSARFPPPGL